MSIYKVEYILICRGYKAGIYFLFYNVKKYLTFIVIIYLFLVEYIIKDIYITFIIYK